MEIRKKYILLCIILLCILQFVSFGQNYEGVYYVQDSTKAFGKILPKGQLIVDRETTTVWSIPISTTSITQSLQTTYNKVKIGGDELLSGAYLIEYTDGVNPLSESHPMESGDIIYIDTAATKFDSDRTILRTLSIGDNVAGEDIRDMFEYMYYTPPTISITISPITTVYEIGTTNSITISGTTTYYGDVLSNGAIKNGGGTITYYSFETSSNFSKNISFTPKETPVDTFDVTIYTFRAFQDYVGTESGVAQSSVITIYGVYPYFSLISNTDYSEASPTVVYNAFVTNKSVQAETISKTVSYTGTGYVYLLYPSVYGHITEILNPSGFDEFLSFTEYSVTITSTDMDVDYTDISYYMVKSDNIKYGLIAYSYTYNQ